MTIYVLQEDLAFKIANSLFNSLHIQETKIQKTRGVGKLYCFFAIYWVMGTIHSIVVTKWVAL